MTDRTAGAPVEPRVWPDAATVAAFLQHAGRRLQALAAARGAAAGLAAALLVVITLALLGRSPGSGAAAAIAVIGAAAGAALALAWHRRGPPTAVRVERRAPASRNVVLTAAELIAQPDRVSPWIGSIVCRDAARVVDRLDPRALFPARGPTLAIGAAAGAWALLLALTLTGTTPALPAIAARADDAPEVLGVDVAITPPAYTGLPQERVSDPARISALAGSSLTVTVRARAAAVTLETLAGTLTLAHQDGNTFTATVTADADGFLALEPRDADSVRGLRRLIGLTVLPDQPPTVRITAPGKDLLLPHGAQAVDLALEAMDDHAVASLRLTFTRVTGFGEQFTFTEGEVPLDVTRADERAWTARARWALEPLELAAGDMLVYRAVATDRRPGAPPAESETWMIEIVAPNAVASGGMAVDDEFDRYALSQQMVILLTERLMARRNALSDAEFAAEAQQLAAAQRRVRAEFVFMIGGELEDEAHADDAELHEEAHALADEEMAMGRLANQGRIDLARAIQAMSVAATELSRVSMEPALAAEKQALQYVQRAFARTRYILRALTERERIDLSRRLTGVLAGAVRDTRPQPNPVSDPELEALRTVLSDAAALASGHDPSAAGAAAALAERVLRVDPSAEGLRDVAAALTAAASAFAAGDGSAAAARLDEAVTTLSALVRARLPQAPGAHRPAAADRLEGVFADELRAGGGR